MKFVRVVPPESSMEWRHTSSPVKKVSNRPFQLARSCAQCFGIEKAFYL
jgi:hypothetical protein